MATREIALTQGQVALVDADDFDRLNQHKWCAARIHRGKFVALRRLPSRRAVYMHREVLGIGADDEMQADHINHDTLDNRRSNLRAVTPRANKQYQPSRSGSSSQFVGVTWDGSRGKWRAQVSIDGKVINLGRYASEVEAAAARDEWVRQNGTAHKLNL